MQINQAGLDIIKEREGFREEAYQDTGNVWTIGYGTTAAAGVGITPVRGMKITREQAEDYLRKYLVKVEAQVMSLVHVPLNENQFSALCSFVYNLGPTQFRNSTLLRKLNRKDYAGAATEFDKWVFDNGQRLNGLVIRRKMEKELFLTPVDTPMVSQGKFLEAVVEFLKGLFK